MFGRAESGLEQTSSVAPVRPVGDRSAGVRRSAVGPYDAEDPAADGADRAPGYVDFGSLRIRIPARAQLQVEKGSADLLRAVHLLVPSGRVSLSALAAPRSSPLWRGLAQEIAESLSNDGARVRSEWGEWGREVQAGSNGALSRFIGVDGPRWMLYGVATGPADGAAELAGSLREMIRGTVVFRGAEPLPVKTVLPLQVPEHLEDRVEQAREANARRPSANPVAPKTAPPPTRQPMAAQRPPSSPPPSSPPPSSPPPSSPPPSSPPAPSKPPAAGGYQPVAARLPAAGQVGPATRSIGARPIGQPPRRVSPPAGPAGLPPVPAYPSLGTNDASGSPVEATWSSANPVVSADQLAEQPAWALLGQAPAFWPHERYLPAAPDPGTLDDARPSALVEPIEPPIPPEADPADDRPRHHESGPLDTWSASGADPLSATDALHRVLIHDAAATQDWLANADRRGRHRRS